MKNDFCVVSLPKHLYLFSCLEFFCEFRQEGKNIVRNYGALIIYDFFFFHNIRSVRQENVDREVWRCLKIWSLTRLTFIGIESNQLEAAHEEDSATGEKER